MLLLDVVISSREVQLLGRGRPRGKDGAQTVCLCTHVGNAGIQFE